MNNDCKYDFNDFMAVTGFSFEEASELYMGLVDELQEGITDLKDNLSVGNIDNIKRIIHNIKGISGNYRISDVFDYSAGIDMLLRQKDTEKALGMIDRLIDIIEASMAEIRRYFA